MVDGIGHWTLERETNRSNGTLAPPDLAALVSAVKDTRLESATGRPTCAASYDGTSEVYVWHYRGTTHQASSCDHPIDENDPLAVEIRQLAITTGGRPDS